MAEGSDAERSLQLQALGTGVALGVTADRLEHLARRWIDGGDIPISAFRNAVRQYIARLEDHVGDAVLLRDALNEMEVGTISEE